MNEEMPPGDFPADPDIRQSWYRSSLAGLNPGSQIVLDEPAQMNLQSRLVRAATPVLHGLERHLNDSNFGLLLADNEGYILHRSFGTSKLGAACDRLGVVVGAQFTEQTSGTNAISTPIETRKGVFVLGEQHFLECLRDQICFGLPIFQPGTRRLEGVLNIMGPGRESPGLMKPVLTSAVWDIQQRLLNSYSDSQVALLMAFRATCDSHRRMPVVAVEPSETFTNGAAAIELDSSDLAMLREFAARPGFESGARVVMNLSAGPQAVEVARVSEQGAVFRVLRDEEGNTAVPRATVRFRTVGDELLERLSRARTAAGHVMIVGEPGTGRTTAARAVGGDDAPVIDARDAVTGAKQWATRLKELAEGAAGEFIVESAHLLDPRLKCLLADVLESTSARVVVTSDDDVACTDQLSTMCRSVLELPTVRQRRAELASIVELMLAARGAKSVRFTLPAIQALAGQDWLGNYREVAAAVDEVLLSRSSGDVTVADIPERYRTPSRRRNLGLLEQAEFDTMRKVLERVCGNKVQAAQLLGISRSTLYARMRALGLS